MAQGVDEVEATVDTMVFDVSSVETGLISQVLVVLLVAVVYHWLPAGGKRRSHH